MEHIRIQPVYEGWLYSANRYIVKWKSRLTGLEGQSQETMAKSVAEEVVRRMNEKWPDIEHWVERA